jgi:hypothetical protein
MARVSLGEIPVNTKTLSLVDLVSPVGDFQWSSKLLVARESTAAKTWFPFNSIGIQIFEIVG